MNYPSYRRAASRAPLLSQPARVRRKRPPVTHPSVSTTTRPSSSGAPPSMGPLFAAPWARCPRRAGLARSKLVPELLAARSSHLPPRSWINESLVEHRYRLREETQLRWEGEGSLAARRILPHTLGSDTAEALISSSYASTKQGNYQRLWETFQAYCTQNSLLSMPASSATICAYLGYMYDRGSVRGGSIRPYIAAMAAKHRTMGLPDPTTTRQVSHTRRGVLA